MGFDVKGITVEINGDTTKLNAALRQIDTQFSGLSKAANSLKKAINSVGKDASMDSYKVQVQLLGQQMKQTESKIHACREAIANWSGTMERLQADLDNTQAKMVGLSTAIAQHKEKLNALNNEHKTTGTLLAQQQADYDATMSKVQQLGNIYKTNLQVEKQRQAEYSKESTALDKLNASRDKAVSAQGKLETKIGVLSNKIVEQEAAVQRYENAWIQAETALKRYTSQSDATEEGVQKLTQKVDDAKAKWQSAITTLENSKLKLANLNQEFGNAKAKVAEYDAKIEASKNKLESLGSQLDETKRKSEQYKQAIVDTKRTLEEQRSKLEQTKETYSQQAEAIAKTKSELNRLTVEYNQCVAAEKDLKGQIETEKESYMTLQAKLQELTETYKRLRQEQMNALAHTTDNLYGWGQTVGTTLEEAGKKIDAFGNKLRVISMASGAALVYGVKSAMDFESAWTGVTKTVEGTPEQLEAINQGLKELALNTASSYEDIAKNAEMAGQMGVATDEVLEFTKAVTMLGDTTNLAGEQAAQTIAKFANVMTDSKNWNDYYMRLGNTVVDLGNNFATTEADIMNMSMRMAAAGSQIGMTSPEVMALATSLSSLGLKTDEAGSSMSKLMQKIALSVATGNDDLAKFAKAAGMSSDQFCKSWGENAPQAFLQFLESIASLEDGSERLQALDEAGVTSEIRMTRSVGALVGSIDLYKNALAKANAAWGDNNAMLTEAEKRYGTLESKVNQAKEAIKQAAASLVDAATPMLKDVCENIKEACKWFSNLDEGARATTAKMLMLGTAAWPVAKGIGKITTFTGKSIKALTGMSGAASKVAKHLGLAKEAATASTGAIAAESAEAGVATASWLGLGKAFVTAHATALGAGGALLGVAAAEGAVIYQTYKGIKAKKEEYAANNKAIQSWREQKDRVAEWTQAASDAVDNVHNLKVGYKALADNTEYYIDTLKELTGKENLTALDKAQQQYAIDQLNALYPDLGLHIDEATGKIVDQTGKVYENKKALDELKQSVLDLAKAEANAEILKETEMAMRNAEAGMKQTQKNLRELQEEEYRAWKQFHDNLDASSMSKWQLANETLLESQREVVAEMETNEATLTTVMAQQLDTLAKGGESTAAEYKASTERIFADAAQNGLEVPQKFAEGIRNGTADVDQAIADMAALNTLNAVLAETDLIGQGKLIPTELANGILNNAPTLEQGVQNLQRAVDFTELTQSSQLAGTAISDALAQGVADGSITVQEAMEAMYDYSGQKLEALADKTGVTADQINAAMEQIRTGAMESRDGMKKAVDEMTNVWQQSAGAVMTNAATYINGAVTAISGGASSMRGSISAAKTGIDNDLSAIEQSVSGAITRVSQMADRLRSLVSSVNSAVSSASASAGTVTKKTADLDGGFEMRASTALGGIGAYNALGTEHLSNALGGFGGGTEVRVSDLLNSYNTNPYNSNSKITTRMIPNTPGQGLFDLSGLAINVPKSVQEKITVEIPVILNGREVARMCAEDIRKEISRIDRFNGRLKGVFV